MLLGEDHDELRSVHELRLTFNSVDVICFLGDEVLDGFGYDLGRGSSHMYFSVDSHLSLIEFKMLLDHRDDE